MHYFKNIEIARLYGVTPTTVSNWVDGATQKRNNLQLIEVRGKPRIINSEQNRFIMNGLVEKGKVHKNKHAYTSVIPKPEFYTIFNEDEVSEIIWDLEVKNEINFKFNYRHVGATQWNDYCQKDNDRIALGEIKSFASNLKSYIRSLLPKDKHIQLVDIGSGNGIPAIEFMEHIDYGSQLVSYVSIDINSDMQQICIDNVDESNKNIVTHAVNTDFELFDLHKIITKINHSHNSPIQNIFLYFGGLIGNIPNIPHVISNICRGLNPDDILIIEANDDPLVDILPFPIDISYEKDNIRNWILDMLNIDVSALTIRSFYNSKEGRKVKEVILDKDYEIRFEEYSKSKTLQLNKGLRINTYSFYNKDRYSLLQVLTQNGLEVLCMYSIINSNKVFYITKINKNKQVS